MNEPKYRRVLLKISGEALAGEAHRGLDFDVIGSVCDVVKKCVEAGVQVGIVVGGGNFWRGLTDGGVQLVLMALRKAGLYIPYKAFLTPTNKDWTAGQLFGEMYQEHRYMQEMQKSKHEQK